MRELCDWLERLEEFVGAPGTRLRESMKRLLAPSSLMIDRSVIRVVDVGQRMDAFGRLPGSLGVLTWVDHADHLETVAEQAIAAQLAALLTLATNRRVEVAASDVTLTMEGSEARTFLPSGLVLDRSLSGPLPSGVQSEFEKLLSSLYGLAAADCDAVGAGAELHYASVLLFDVEPNAAYALAVAGIERLSRAYGDAPADWTAWERAGALDRVFDQVGLNDEQAGAIRMELLKDRHLRLRQTFARYVVDALPASFWDAAVEDFMPTLEMQSDGTSTFTGVVESEPRPLAQFVPPDPDLLRRRLLASYDARSSYVHEGRRHASPARAIAQLLETVDSVDALPYAGLRAVLRTLLLIEIERRSHPRPLPSVVIFDNVAGDGTGSG